tara:strand:+ start:1596 stop:1991 length:396 start_codon:yes stop_codon:yes gene_type:complete
VTIENTFREWHESLNGGEADKLFKFMDSDIVIFDEDIPWRFNKDDFANHLSFHGDQWESFEWIPREVCFQKRGETAVVSGYATFRGKPKDAGFRQRFMGFTQTWQKIDGDFLLVSFHQGPLQGQIEGASPS